MIYNLIVVGLVSTKDEETRNERAVPPSRLSLGLIKVVVACYGKEEPVWLARIRALQAVEARMHKAELAIVVGFRTERHGGHCSHASIHVQATEQTQSVTRHRWPITEEVPNYVPMVGKGWARPMQLQLTIVLGGEDPTAKGATIARR